MINSSDLKLIEIFKIPYICYFILVMQLQFLLFISGIQQDGRTVSGLKWFKYLLIIMCIE